MRTQTMLIAVLTSSLAFGQVPAGTGGTAADADKGDFAPPSTGCGNVGCEIAAACASADPGVAADMCDATVRSSHAIRLAAMGKPADAPLVEPAPAVFPPGDLPPGKSAKLATGQPAPFRGQLLDEQEQVRRARVNARNEAELADLKRGNVTISVPVAIAIVAGVLVAGAAAGTAVTLAAKPKP